MKTVALFGFNERSRDMVWDIADDPDTEIWSCNWAIRYNPPRIDRLFEIHQLSLLEEPHYDLKHWEWIHEEHPFPIYMQDVYPNIPASVKYPKDAVLADVFEFIHRGDERNDFEVCSPTWMISLAIHEKVDRIKIYGIEAGAETEFIYQKEGIGHLLGIAGGRGIHVDLVPDSMLLRGKLYGYEAVQVITRHQLEIHRSNYQQQHMDYLGRLNRAKAIFDERMRVLKKETDAKANKARLRKMELKAQEAAGKSDEMMMMAHGASCALQAVNHLIEEVDSQEPDLQLVNTMREVKMDE